MKTVMLVLGMLMSTAAFAAPGGGRAPLRDEGPTRAQVQRGQDQGPQHRVGRFDRHGKGRRVEQRGKHGHARGHDGRCGAGKAFHRHGRR